MRNQPCGKKERKAQGQSRAGVLARMTDAHDSPLKKAMTFWGQSTSAYVSD
jgi:hypothetical protein